MFSFVATEHRLAYWHCRNSKGDKNWVHITLLTWTVIWYSHHITCQSKWWMKKLDANLWLDLATAKDIAIITKLESLMQNNCSELRSSTSHFFVYQINAAMLSGTPFFITFYYLIIWIIAFRLSRNQVNEFVLGKLFCSFRGLNTLGYRKQPICDNYCHCPIVAPGINNPMVTCGNIDICSGDLS